MSFKIIPEDAGNTLDVVEQRLLRQDHPRGCGEHRLRMMKPMVLSGSSPRIRGAQVTISVLLFGQGSSPQMREALSRTRGSGSLPAIIPADAGSTPQSSPHPR